MSSSGKAWTFAEATIYDEKRPHVLAVRGTIDGLDVWDDLNPQGIGFKQFSSNIGIVSDWLKEVSQPEKDVNNTPLVNLKPDITGHSLGGALTQWIAGGYLANTDPSYKLGSLVGFNSPAISKEGAKKIDLNRVDSTIINLMSADIVSLVGDDYSSGSTVNLFDYSLGILGAGSIFNFTNGNRGIFNTHSVPMYMPKNGNFSNPSPSKRVLSGNEASSDLFTYFPDPDYMAFVAAITSLTTASKALLPAPLSLSLSLVLGTKINLIGPSLIFRGTAETAHQKLGTNLRELLSLIETSSTVREHPTYAVSICT